MTFVLYGVGGLALLFLAVMLIGMLMPERYTGSSTVAYAKSVEDVWDALLDFDQHPMTGKMMKSTHREADQDGLPVWTEDMGRGELITVKTIEAERPKRMLRTMASRSLPMASRWEYLFESTADGCRLTLEGETFIRSGSWLAPVFRVMMTLGGGVKKGLDIQMDMVAATLGIEAQRK